MKEEKMKKKSNSLKFIFIGVVTTVILFIGAFTVYKDYLVNSFSDFNFRLFIRPTTQYSEIIDTLSTKVSNDNVSRFNRISRLGKYDKNVKTGSYLVNPGMSVYDVYKMVSTGNQTPVKVTFNNIRTAETFAKRLSSQLMVDSTTIMNALNSPELQEKFGFNQEDFVSMFLPDTYEFYWTVSVEDFLYRMKREYDKYWTPERLEKAGKLNLTPKEVAILASIAEEETNNKQERGVVGRLYLNRIEQGMPLQADPTVKFALKDFGLRRIKNEHLKHDSPYNTYKNKGLPPGPIRIPTKQTMDSILNSEPHEYIYMVAKEDFSGRHNFATNYKQHLQYANRYRQALNRRKIY